MSHLTLSPSQTPHPPSLTLSSGQLTSTVTWLTMQLPVTSLTSWWRASSTLWLVNTQSTTRQMSFQREAESVLVWVMTMTSHRWRSIKLASRVVELILWDLPLPMPTVHTKEWREQRWKSQEASCMWSIWSTQVYRRFSTRHSSICADWDRSHLI